MILYFSGSGNSLAVARQISNKTGEQVVPLREAAGKDLTGEKRIGLVFPTYWLDAPIAMRELVPQLHLSAAAYVYVVVTCGAQTNNAMWTVRRLLRKQGVKVAYCHKIRVPDSSALAFGRDPNQQAWKFDRYRSRLEQIIQDVATEQHGMHFSGSDPFGWLLSRPSVAAKTQKVTRPNVNAEQCVGCGICAKICPQDNIVMVCGGALHASATPPAPATAQIGDRCTACLACVHFCPHLAVEINGKAVKKEFRYHHPDIKLADMVLR